MSGRIAHACAAGDLVLPNGRIVVIGALPLLDLQALPRDQLVLLVNTFPDHASLTEQGYDVRVLPPGDLAAMQALGRFDMALVVVPRAKAAVKVALALARALSDHIVVDGAKDDGIESVLKDIRRVHAPDFVHSKSHGKIFGFSAKGLAGDWPDLSAPALVGDWWTTPGAFSADGPDRGSVALAQALPPLKGRVVDLGAGWGYLSAQVLAKSPAVSAIDLVEADFAALTAARLNVTDSRASFHWADARDADRALLAADAVVMNPPFHIGRAAEPALGQDFIRTAKALLKRDGVLYMVANRQLPYESVLADCFNLIQIMEGPEVSGFKLIRASGPKQRTRIGQKR